MKKKYRKTDDENYRSILSETGDIGEEIRPLEEKKKPAISAKQIHAAMAIAEAERIVPPRIREPKKDAKTDTFTRLKIGGERVYRLLLRAITEPDGRANVIYLLLMTSGLCGVACDEAAKATGKNITDYLISNRLSVCNLAAGTYHRLNPTLPVPKTAPIAAHVQGHIHDNPYKIGDVDVLAYAYRYDQLWAYFHPILDKCCQSPESYPILYALALQRAIEKAQEVANPEATIRFAFENTLFSAMRRDMARKNTPE